jgi:dienelactone hydrolase
MKRMNLFSACCFVLAFVCSSCGNQPAPTATADSTNAAPSFKEENITYYGDSATMSAYVVYDANTDKKRPAILVLPEWWGMTDYPKMRARELAKLGYIAMAIDLYGDGKTAENPELAGKLAGPFYANPQKAKTRIDAAIEKLKTYNQTDPANIAAIGYCFGGGILLNTARLGDADLKGVVSFHGSLTGTPAVMELLKTKILVCHGGADNFVPSSEVAAFKKQMDSIGAEYTFKTYEDATHAFTNPGADEMAAKFNMPIRYNAVADSASWNDMKTFFAGLFN